jgi:RNA polymerase sigma-70 factor (ECF subfamily)
VAFDHLRERQRRSWQVDSHRAIENATVDHVTAEVRASSRDVYRVLEKLPSAERAAFRLRYVDEMDMSEVAAACRVSLATAKRRLARAESRFRTLALRQPGLADWMQSQNA